MEVHLLKKLGFSDKEAAVYLALLRLGPTSVRSLADECNLNRGTTYDALKWLSQQGLVNFYHQETKQHFVAEDPEKLERLLKERVGELESLAKQLQQEVIPELKSLYDKGGERPVAKYYEKQEGFKHILEDVLATVEASGEKMYRIYSAVRIRQHLYEKFTEFSKERIKRGIRVRVIALGDGGELRGLDERKWLKVTTGSQTYILIYNDKTAYISLNSAKQPIGVVIENQGVAHTQKLIFDQLWEKLS